MSPTPAATGARPAPPWGLPECFVVAQTAGPAILYLPGTQSFRVLVRVGVFAVGLAGLVGMGRRPTGARHPSGRPLALAVAYLALMVFHPATNTLVAGVAQVLLSLAIVAPAFWAPWYFRGDPARLARALTILWLFNGASAAVGILQVRDPAWLPAEFSSVSATTRQGGTALQYKGSDGRSIVRPPGLGDAPGAAGAAGLLTATMGLAYLSLPVSRVRRGLAVAGIVVGATVIFLSHIRTALLMLLGSAVAFVALMLLQRRVGTAAALVAAMVGCGAVVLRSAEDLGGRSTMDRFASLVAADPLTVYERSARMGMVTEAFDSLIVDYPLGGGLARFGMMRGYFGDESNADSPPVWAEVQIPAWVIEGGAPLLGLYLLAVAVAVGRLLRDALAHPSPGVRLWAGVVAMLSASPVALMFSYCPFYSQVGMQFWFLAGAMEGVAAGPEGGPGDAGPRG